MVGLNGFIFMDDINRTALHEIRIPNQDLMIPNNFVSGIDIDFVNDVIYFTDITNFNIKKIFRNGTGLTTVVEGISYMMIFIYIKLSTNYISIAQACIILIFLLSLMFIFLFCFKKVCN